MEVETRLERQQSDFFPSVILETCPSLPVEENQVWEALDVCTPLIVIRALHPNPVTLNCACLIGHHSTGDHISGPPASVKRTKSFDP